MPLHDAVEDQFHCIVLEFVNGEGVEVTEESGCDGVTPATWWAHGCYQDNVHQIDLMMKIEGLIVHTIYMYHVPTCMYIQV